jgi:molybdopterin-binding protein
MWTLPPVGWDIKHTLSARSESRPSIHISRLHTGVYRRTEASFSEDYTGDIMADLVVMVGKHSLERVITRQGTEYMKLKKGDSVEAIINSTEVVLKQ